MFNELKRLFESNKNFEKNCWDAFWNHNDGDIYVGQFGERIAKAKFYNDNKTILINLYIDGTNVVLYKTKVDVVSKKVIENRESKSNISSDCLPKDIPFDWCINRIINLGSD